MDRFYNKVCIMEITVKLFHGAACLLIIHRNRPIGVTKRIGIIGNVTIVMKFILM